MDPLSASIGLVSFISDVVDLGYKIKHSIDKTKWNRKKLRRLADDIISNLCALQAFYDEKKDVLDGSPSEKLIISISQLRSEMWRVSKKCQAMINAGESPRGTIKSFGSSFRAWNNRDTIEEDIMELRNRVRDCQLQFMTFAVARIESAVLVQGSENNVMLRKLEVAGNHMLVNTDYGYNIIRRVEAEILMPSDVDSIERQYLTLQATQLADSVLQALSSISDSGELVAHSRLEGVFETEHCIQLPFGSLIRDIFRISACLQSLKHQTSADLAFDVHGIYAGIAPNRSCLREAVAIGMAAVTAFRAVARLNPRATPYWAMSLVNLSISQDDFGQHEEAISSASDALTILCSAQLSYPERASEFRPMIARARRSLSIAMEAAGRKTEAISVKREAVEDFAAASNFILHGRRSLFQNQGGLPSNRLSGPEQATIMDCFNAVGEIVKMLEDESPRDAFDFAKRALCITEFLSDSEMPPEAAICRIYLSAMSSLTKIYVGGNDLVDGLAEDAVTIFRRLSKAHPHHFSLYFLRVQYAYIYIQQLTSSSNSSAITLTDADFQTLGSILHDGPIIGDIETPRFYPFSALRLDAEHFLPIGSVEGVLLDVISAACAVDLDLLESVIFDVEEGIRLFIGALVLAFPSEASNALAQLLELEQDILVHPSFMFALRYLPIPFMQAIVDKIMEKKQFQDTEQWFWTNANSSRTFGDFCCRSLRYQNALTALGGDNIPDSPLYARILDELGNHEDSIAVLRRLVETASDGWGHNFEEDFVVWNLMETLCCQRRYYEALGVAKDYITKTSDREQKMSENTFCLLRASSYLGIGQAKCAITSCELLLIQMRVSLAASWSIHDHFYLAYALNILAKSFLATGNLEAAYGCAEESASFYDMYNVSDELYFWASRADRADVFHTFATTLLALGECERALTTIDRAVSLYREIEQNSPRYQIGHASALETCAKIYWANGKKSECLAIQKAAVEKWIVAASDNAHLAKDAASSLQRLGGYLVGEGKGEEASTTLKDVDDWTRKHADKTEETLDSSYWELFPDDCPEGFTLRPKPEELSTPSLGSDSETLIEDPLSPGGSNVPSTVAENPISEPKNEDIPAVAVSDNSSSTFFSVTGWLDKVIDQSAQLQIGAVVF